MIASHLSIARSLSKKKKWWPSLRRKMSALKKVGGKKKDVVFVHEPSLQQSLLLSSAPITWGVMEAWEGFFFFFAYTWSEWQQKLPEVLQSMNDSLTQWSCHLGCFFSCSRQSKRTEWCMMCGWQSEYMCSGGGGRWEEVTVNGGDPQTSLPLWVSLSLSVDAHMFPLCCCSPLLHSVDICMCVWGDSAVLYYICHPSFHLSQVLPWLLQTHCCLFFEKDSGKRWERVIKSNITMRCSFTLTGSFSLDLSQKEARSFFA